MVDMRIARHAAETHGYAWDDVEILQQTNCVVAWLRSSGVVVKAGQWPDSERGMLREHEVCRQLSAAGAPVAEPLATPVIDDETGLVASLWRHIPSTPAADATPDAVGRLLRSVYRALDAVELELPGYEWFFDLFAASLFDDAEMASLDEGDRALLRRAYEEVRPAIDGADVDLHTIHGEPHRRNILATDHHLVLIDFETVSRGPIEWDLACLEPAVAEHFPDADPELVELLRRMNSIRIATWCYVNGTAEELRLGRQHFELATELNR